MFGCSHTHTQKCTFTHTKTHKHMLSLTEIHIKHTNKHTPTTTHMHKHTLKHTLTHALSHTHIQALTLKQTHTHPHTLPQTQTNTHQHMLSVKQTHSPTLAHTHTSTHPTPSATSSRQTNKRPLLADFISFRGYRTDWVSTTLAVRAYRSKAATGRISRAADAIKKTGKKHFSGTQWRNNLVCHLESRNVCCTMRGSPESLCWRQHLNGQTLGPQPALPCQPLSPTDLAAINLFPHQCYTDVPQRPIKKR